MGDYIQSDYCFQLGRFPMTVQTCVVVVLLPSHKESCLVDTNIISVSRYQLRSRFISPINLLDDKSSFVNLTKDFSHFFTYMLVYILLQSLLVKIL